MDIRPKVLITKIGLDGHDRGSRIVAAHLRDAGMEVVYTPPWQEIATVVKLAREEDVDVIGISLARHRSSDRAQAHDRVARRRARRRRRDRRRHRSRRGRDRAARGRRRARVPSGLRARRHRRLTCASAAAQLRSARATLPEGDRIDEPSRCATPIPRRPKTRGSAGSRIPRADRHDREVVNRSGIRIHPLYTPRDWTATRCADASASRPVPVRARHLRRRCTGAAPGRSAS